MVSCFTCRPPAMVCCHPSKRAHFTTSPISVTVFLPSRAWWAGFAAQIFWSARTAGRCPARIRGPADGRVRGTPAHRGTLATMRATVSEHCRATGLRQDVCPGTFADRPEKYPRVYARSYRHTRKNEGMGGYTLIMPCAIRYCRPAMYS